MKCNGTAINHHPRRTFVVPGANAVSRRAEQRRRASRNSWGATLTRQCGRPKNCGCYFGPFLIAMPESTLARGPATHLSFGVCLSAPRTYASTYRIHVLSPRHKRAQSDRNGVARFLIGGSFARASSLHYTHRATCLCLKERRESAVLHRRCRECRSS